MFQCLTKILRLLTQKIRMPALKANRQSLSLTQQVPIFLFRSGFFQEARKRILHWYQTKEE